MSVMPVLMLPLPLQCCHVQSACHQRLSRRDHRRILHTCKNAFVISTILALVLPKKLSNDLIKSQIWISERRKAFLVVFFKLSSSLSSMNVTVVGQSMG